MSILVFSKCDTKYGMMINHYKIIKENEKNIGWQMLIHSMYKLSVYVHICSY